MFNNKNISVIAEQRLMSNWIPVNEQLPDTTDDILIAWMNKNPIEYGEGVKNYPKVSVGYYERHKWYLYSETLKSFVNEYKPCNCMANEISDDMEIIAWMLKPW